MSNLLSQDPEIAAALENERTQSGVVIYVWLRLE